MVELILHLRELIPPQRRTNPGSAAIRDTEHQKQNKKVRNHLVLKYQKKSSGRMVKDRELILEINGIKHYDYLQHDIRVECLKRALTKLNGEITEVAENFKNHKFGAYLWLYTPINIRGEELEGLYRLYFLVEIIKYLHRTDTSSKLISEAPLDKNIKNVLHDEGIKFYTKRILCVKNQIHTFIKSSLVFLRIMYFNIGCMFLKSNDFFKGTLINVGATFNNHRYDDIEKISSIYGKVKYFTIQNKFIRGIAKTETVEFKKELNISTLFYAVGKAIRIWIFVLQNKSGIPAGIYHRLHQVNSFFQYIELIIFETCVNKFFNKFDINKILLLTNLAIPKFRLLTSIAGQKGIETINVASRTYGPYECSDILLDCDVEEYNNTRLADWFIVKDRYSFEKSFGQFPALHDRVLVGGRYIFENHQLTGKQHQQPPALLILFSHKKNISDRLLEDVIESGLPSQVETIIYRCHDFYIYDQKKICEAFPGKKIINITSKDYAVMNDYRVLTITGPTTAAVEAMQAGSVVFWVPWVWDESIIIDDLMRNVGLLSQNIDELANKAMNLINDPNHYNRQLNKDEAYYKQFFATKLTISDRIKEIILNDRMSIKYLLDYI